MISKKDGEHRSPHRIIVDIPRQVLELHVSGIPIASYPISTSRFGEGAKEGSFRTPTGRFRICQKIGENSPPWTIFKARTSTGEVASPGGDEDMVLSRILWLDGLDEDNKNTRDRYIYIHGTNQEDLIGIPASHGCIRLRNQDMIDLYGRTPENTEVLINP